jgi:hypothetical protein
VLPLGGLRVKHAVQRGIWVPTQHVLWDQGKPWSSWPVAGPSGCKPTSSQHPALNTWALTLIPIFASFFLFLSFLWNHLQVAFIITINNFDSLIAGKFGSSLYFVKNRWRWRWSRVTTDGHSVGMSWRRAHCGTCDQILILSEFCCLVSVGRPLWREVGSRLSLNTI